MIPNTASSGSGVLKNRKNVVPGSALTIGVLAQNNSRAVATRATGTATDTTRTGRDNLRMGGKLSRTRQTTPVAAKFEMWLEIGSHCPISSSDQSWSAMKAISRYVRGLRAFEMPSPP